MGRIVSHAKEERFVFVPLAIFVPKVFYCLVSLVFHRKLLRVVPVAECIPVMRILVLIEGAIGIPIREAVAMAFWGVSVPFWPPIAYIMSRIVRIVLGRGFCVKFSD